MRSASFPFQETANRSHSRLGSSDPDRSTWQWSRLACPPNSTAFARAPGWRSSHGWCRRPSQGSATDGCPRKSRPRSSARPGRPIRWLGPTGGRIGRSGDRPNQVTREHVGADASAGSSAPEPGCSPGCRHCSEAAVRRRSLNGSGHEERPLSRCQSAEAVLRRFGLGMPKKDAGPQPGFPEKRSFQQLPIDASSIHIGGWR